MDAVTTEWYVDFMSGNYSMTVGDRGRVVLPVELRTSLGWREGTELLVYETPAGVVLTTQAELLKYVRAQFAGGPSVVDELIAERRAESLREDAESLREVAE